MNLHIRKKIDTDFLFHPVIFQSAEIRKDVVVIMVVIYVSEGPLAISPKEIPLIKERRRRER